jgi:hypothetical protein
MKITDALNEITHHFADIDELDVLAVRPTKERCYLTAMRRTYPQVAVPVDLTYLREPIDGLVAPFGIIGVGLIRSILKHPDLKCPIASWHSGKDGKMGLLIAGDNNATHLLSLSTGSILQEKPFAPPSLERIGVSWCMDFVVNSEAVAQLKYWLNVAQENIKNDPSVTVLTRGRRVFGRFPNGPHEFLQFPLGQICSGALDPHFAYNAQMLLRLLRFVGNDERVAVKLSDKGCLAVQVDSNLGHYTYVMFGTRVHEPSAYADALAAAEINFAEARMAAIAAAE